MASTADSRQEGEADHENDTASASPPIYNDNPPISSREPGAPPANINLLNEQLAKAGWQGEYKTCEELLSQGAQPDGAFSHCHHSCLNAAARNGFPRIVKLLIDHDADIESRCQDPWRVTPLQQAAFHGRFECARILIENGADTESVSGPGCSGRAVDIARKQKNRRWKDIVKLCEGAKSTSESFFNPGACETITVRKPSGSLLLWLNSYPAKGGPRRDQPISNHCGVYNWPLQAAGMKGDVKEIERLTGDGIDPNIKMTTWFNSEALGWAASFGQLGAIIALIKAGANPFLPPNQAGFDPRADAVRERHHHVVKFLDEYKRQVKSGDFVESRIPVKATELKSEEVRYTGTGKWEEHQNIDMCGQGDVEIISNWRASHSIEDLKRIVEKKGYSAISVGCFGHAALKKFDYQLTAKHCATSHGYTNQLFIWFPGQSDGTSCDIKPVSNQQGTFNLSGWVGYNSRFNGSYDIVDGLTV